ncbi:hypothetical protein NON20_14635 [Synechocystis sp. B12]|nr:hypothetical protein NON20_14635 [Synechocystis sp. B12]
MGSKIRIFEDEMLEFERVLHQLISIASGQMHVSADNLSQSSSIEVESKDLSWENNSDICPNFFPILATTNNWQEFEKYTFLLLKSLGIVTIKSFLGEKQAGKADGFFGLLIFQSFMTVPWQRETLKLLKVNKSLITVVN